MVSKTLKEELPVIASNTACIAVDAVEINPISAVANLANVLLASVNISNMYFAKKLSRFLLGISEMSLGERVKFHSKYIDDKENEFAEKLLLIIEKIDDLSKAFILANLCRSLSDGIINLNMFMRLSKALVNTLIEDLYYLKRNDDKKKLEYNCHSDTLLNNGFYRRSRALYPSGEDSKEFACEVTELGQMMIRCGLSYYSGYISFEELQKNNNKIDGKYKY